jgi:hypothetical protein
MKFLFGISVPLFTFLVGVWISLAVHGDYYVGRLGDPNGPCVALEAGQPIGNWRPSSNGKCYLSSFLWTKILG